MQFRRVVSLAGLGCVVLALPMRLLPAAPDQRWDQLMQAATTAVDTRQLAVAGELYTSAIHELAAAGVTDAPLARALLELGRVRDLQGQFQQAADLVLRAIPILDAQPQPDAFLQTAAWEELGTAYYRQRQYSKAEQALRHALDLEQGASATRTGKMAEILTSLASVCQSEHNYVEAEALFGRALSILDRDPRADPLEEALLLNNLGLLRRMMGRISEADAAWHRALALLDRTSAPDGGIRVSLLYNVASLDIGRKHYREAAASFQRAVDLMVKGTPLRPGQVAQILREYAACLRKLGDKSQAKNVGTMAAALPGDGPEDRNRRMVVDVTELAAKRP